MCVFRRGVNVSQERGGRAVDDVCVRRGGEGGGGGGGGRGAAVMRSGSEKEINQLRNNIT